MLSRRPSPFVLFILFAVFVSTDRAVMAQNTGACCTCDALCEVVTEAFCAGNNGIYQGDGVSCDDVSCTFELPCPPDCDGTGVGIAIEALVEIGGSLTPSLQPVVAGQEVTFRVTLFNRLQNACNFLEGQLSITLPNGQIVPLAGFGPPTPDVPVVPFGVPFTTTSPVVYVVGESDAVGGILTTFVDYGSTVNIPGQINGLLLADPVQQTASGTASLPLMLGSIDITKTPSTDVTCAGSTVEYIYTITCGPGGAPISDVMVMDDLCDEVEYVSGDGNDNLVLECDETWTYRCFSTLDGPGVVVNTATVTGLVVSAFEMPDMVSAMATASVTVDATPTAVITGPLTVCPGATGITFEATETSMPPLPGATFEWTITGNATFCGGGTTATGAMVCVDADASCNGAFDLFVTVTVGACSSDTEENIPVVDLTPPSITCTDVTVECDGAGNAADLAAFLAGNTCTTGDLCGLVTITADAGPFAPSCGLTGSYAVTFTATDGCDNTATDTATFTIVDTTPPAVACTDLTVECDGAGNAASLAGFLAGSTCTTDDDCSDSVTISAVPDPFVPGCGGTGSQSVTLTATDACGNIATDTATFTIVDATPPVIICTDITVECDGAGNAADFATFLAGATCTAADVCSGPVILSAVPDPFVPGCGGTGSQLVTFTATDACGLTATDTATFTIVDTTPPTIICTDTTVECDGAGNAADFATFLAGATCTAADICSGPVILSAVPDPFVPGCGGTGSQLVTFTATDACGLTATDTATFTIVDTTPPTITCTDATVECDGTGNAVELAAFLAGSTCSVGDTCSGPVAISAVAGPLDPDCGDTGVISVEFTATDACDNTATATATFTIVDTTPPDLTCPPDVTLECTGDTSPGVTGAPTTSDACGIVTVDFSDVVTPGCGNTSQTARTWSAVDACGNVSTCVQAIVLVDTTPPTIDCTDVTVECDGAGNAAAFADFLDGSTCITDDECSTPVAITSVAGPFVPGCGGTGSWTVTFTATDACGNSTPDTATFTIVDTTPPTIACSNVTVECDGFGNTLELAMFLAGSTCIVSDACSEPIAITSVADPIVAGCGGTGTISVMFTGTDLCGNAATDTATFTIVDTTPPAIACADLTVECDGGGNVGEFSMFLAGSTCTTDDACSTPVTISANAAAFSPACGGTGSRVVTFTAIDACGNMATDMATFTIVDTTPPTIACADLTVACDGADNAADLATFLAGVTCTVGDICSEPVAISAVADPIVAACGQSGAITVTFTATDACGNTATDTADLIILDTTPPTITCTGVSVECDGAGNGPDLADFLTGSTCTVGDTCSEPVTITAVAGPLDPACGGTGTIAVTFTATDACGNSATDIATLTIIDTAPPTITCDDVTVECDGAGNGADIIPFLTGATCVTSDVCSAPVTVTANAGAFVPACGGTGAQAVTFTATDACGNTATTMATITIVDTTPPTIACADIAVECDGADNAADLAAFLAGATCTADDGCSASVTITAAADPIIAGCGATGTVNATFTATDACGNTATDTAAFTIVDSAPPTITCPSDRTLECPADTSPASTGSATAGDACGTVIVTFTDVVTAGCGATSTTLRTWTATDDCGLSVSCVQTITVVDTTPPAITCPPNVVVECPADTSPASTGVPMGADVCGPVTPIPSDVITPICTGTYTILRTWTATDECGNDSSCVQVISVIDTTPPEMFNCPDPPVVIIMPGDPIPPPAVVTAMDVCDPAVSEDFYEFSETDECSQTLTRTWTFTDDCSNASACQQVIVIMCVERGHAGWNRVDNRITLTHNEPTYWSTLNGEPKGVSPFTVLDPSPDPFQQGRPAMDGTTDRVMRGFLYAWAVDAQEREIKWNHLDGSATVINYRDGTALEYDAWSFQVVTDVPNGALGLAPYGQLDLDGVEYARGFDQLLLDFQASGSTGLSGGMPFMNVTARTDLTLHPVSADLRQENHGPITTKATFVIWNENETQFTGLDRCITCWDQTMLGLYADAQNHFLVGNLQTDKGKARIDGLASTLCSSNCCIARPIADGGHPGCASVDCQALVCAVDTSCCLIEWDEACVWIAVDLCVECEGASQEASLLGVAAKRLEFNGATALASSGINLIGLGTQSARVVHDIGGTGPPPVEAPTDLVDAMFDAFLPDPDAGPTVRGPEHGGLGADGPTTPSPAPNRAAVGFPPSDRVSGSEKGSLLIFSNIELRWDEDGTFIQDTFIHLTNDWPEDVEVKMYFVNGDAPLAEMFFMP